jgi:amino-acid N-acetyltransferase
VLTVCNDIVFRPAVEGDTRAIVSLLRSAALPFEDLARTTKVRFIVAAHGTQLIGCIGVESAGCYVLLRSFSMLETERGAGIGGRLLEMAERLCRRRGVVATYLLTLTAERFFARRGYECATREDAPPDIKSTAEFAAICPVSSTLMVKRL